MSAGLLVLTAMVAALAIWLWPASLHIVSWDDAGPHRVGVFMPLARLYWSLLGSLAVAAIVWWWPPRTAESRHARARALAPLGLLALCVLPYLPWLPDRMPIFLALAGPLRWGVLALAIALIAAHTRVSAALWSTLSTPSRTTIFLVSLAIYVALGMRSVATIGLKGDEPHYLIISQSLLADGDLRIENNHRQREYRAFTREDIPPDYMQRGQDGAIYSIHAPGLPAVLLPAYAVAGTIGAVLAICVIAAAGALAIFDVAAISAGSAAAVLTWLGIAMSVPFLPYAWSIFPEVPGAAIVAWATLWVVQISGGMSPNVTTGTGPTVTRRDLTTPVSLRRWLARGVALALLPWLHTKFVVLLAPLAALIVLVRLRTRLTAAAALLAPVAVSGVAWLMFFYVIYGSLNPEAPYGNFARDWVRSEFVPRGVLGLLLDQKFGLLWYAPVYLLVAAGAWIARGSAQWRWLLWTLALIAAAYTASSARLYMWWGGWSAPARFLVPALPLVAPVMAIAIRSVMRTRWQPALMLLLGLTLAASIIPALMPERLLLFSDAHGVSRMIETVQGAAPLTATLPTFTESQWRARDLIPRPYPPGVKQAAVLRGRMSLLDAFDPSHRRAFDYASGVTLDAAQWQRTGTITREVAPDVARPPLPPEGIYPEGEWFWTMGTTRARVLVWSGGRENVDVEVRIGPHGGTCQTTVQGQASSPPLEPNGTTTLHFRVPAEAAWVPVTVTATSAFRPADVDPVSADQRVLGCQVRLHLW